MVTLEETFSSKLEDLVETEELLFDSTAGFGSTYKKYLSQAIAHPAKANTRLLEFLIDSFTEEGDLVLDPMGGSGSTGVVAALHGRNAVCVELESKFFKWMEKARKKVEKQQTLTRKGKITNVLGDARHLTELLKKADVIVTSPPYSESMSKKRKGYTTHPNLSETRHMGLDSSDENIGNLDHGKVDVIVTSPPYSEALSQNAGGGSKKGVEGESQIHEEKHLTKPYSTSPENLGNLKHGYVDSIITSPPYEEGMSSKVHTLNTVKQRKIYGEKHWATQYGSSEEQIGNLKKETYLSAMLTVYQQMYSVLKPNGKAIVIIKPFIRNKKVVDLPYQTWLLLKACGFKLYKLFKLRLQQQSFWRILYHRKFPSVPQLKHEYILICTK